MLTCSIHAKLLLYTVFCSFGLHQGSRVDTEVRGKLFLKYNMNVHIKNRILQEIGIEHWHLQCERGLTVCCAVHKCWLNLNIMDWRSHMWTCLSDSMGVHEQFTHHLLPYSKNNQVKMLQNCWTCRDVHQTSVGQCSLSKTPTTSFLSS